jgi:RNA ligase (TIGR02306 family)
MSEELDELRYSEFSDSNPLAEIIRIYDVFNHPNADLLDLVSPDGSNVNFAIVKKGQFKKGDLAIWIDSVNDPMVPTGNILFSFLQKIAKADGYARVRTLRLRGIVSRGLLIPLDNNWVGKTPKELSDLLGLKKYIPRQERPGGSFYSGRSISGPTKMLPISKYDIESLNKNWKEIPNGTPVYLTEKIHGANASFGWLPYNGETKFWARSRTLFKEEPEEGDRTCLWWEAATKYSLKEKLNSKIGFVLYGEIYGNVQDLKYGLGQDIGFVAFDCWDSNGNRYLTWEELTSFCEELDIPMVPLISRFNWNTDSGIPKDIIEMAEGETMLGGSHTREGIVIRADIPDFLIDAFSNIKITKRIIYKLVGNGYLTR